MGAGGQHHAQPALPPRKETQYPMYRRVGGAWGQSEWTWKIMPPPAFDPQNVQPVASHYTDYGILAACICMDKGKCA